MNTLLGSLVVALFACSTVVAQRRQPLVGSVVDAAGKPLAGALVTLVEDDSDEVGLDPVDVCTATTSERGRFVVSALVGVPYTALAVGLEVDGKALVGRPVHRASCGQVCTLRVDLQGRRRRIAMPLAPELRAVPGLHVRMGFPGCPGHHVVLPIDEQGIEVPPNQVVAHCSLRDGQGAFLGTIAVLETGDPVAILPSPYLLAVRVVDDAAKPVEGARVAVQDGSTGMVFEGPAVQTDAKGNASLLWGGWRDPFEDPPETLYVVATKAGFSEGASGWVCKQPFVGFEVAKQHQGRVLLVPLRKSSPPRGVVDKAFAGKKARVSAMGNVRFEPGGVYFLPRQYNVVIDADGSYTVPELAPGASTVRLLLPPLEGRRVVTLPTHAPALPHAEPADCEDLVAQVIDERGGPAIGAQVLLAAHAAGMLVQPLVPDAAGKIERRLQRGRWTLFAMDATGWAACELDGAAPNPLTLRLVAKPQRRVRVLDRDGRAVGGASFEPGDFRYGMPRPAGLDALLVELGWNTFAEHMRAARTDERGEATLHFLPWPGVTPKAFAFVTDHRHRSDDVMIEPADDVLVFHLR
ncbi:MAG TPA: carboxypeptidase-like regulatory domain-containing protein [Planctomycetota bacterium]|nr:carboxypeptidase-like regulatory domain-containing protein [Planctomycetota bacterium]